MWTNFSHSSFCVLYGSFFFTELWRSSFCRPFFITFFPSSGIYLSMYPLCLPYICCYCVAILLLLLVKEMTRYRIFLCLASTITWHVDIKYKSWPTYFVSFHFNMKKWNFQEIVLLVFPFCYSYIVLYINQGESHYAFCVDCRLLEWDILYYRSSVLGFRFKNCCMTASPFCSQFGMELILLEQEKIAFVRSNWKIEFITSKRCIMVS